VIRALADTEDFWRILALRPPLQDDPAMVREIVGWFRAAPADAPGLSAVPGDDDDWDWKD
jgi:hypothetical protein